MTDLGYGETALFTGAGTGHNKVVRLLIQNGACVRVVNDAGETAVVHVLSTGNDKVMRLLVQNGAAGDAVNKNGETALFAAVRTRKDEVVRLLLQNGAAVGVVNKDGETALFTAARIGNDKIVRLLLQNGAVVGVVNKDGETALFTAAKSGNDKILRLLLQNEADVGVVNKDGETALFSAVKTGCYLDFLGTPSNQQCRDLANRNVEIVKILLENGADVDARNNEGETALFHAWRKKDSREDPNVKTSTVMELLVRHGADVNARNKNDKTVLCHILDFTQSTKEIKFLIDSGVDITIRTAKGESVLHLLLTREKRMLSFDNVLRFTRKMVSCFVRDSQYSLAKSRDNQGNSALHYWAAFPIVRDGQSDTRSINARTIGEELVDNGATVNAENDQNQTPLHMAVNWAAAKVLLTNKANPNPQDDQGRTPLLVWTTLLPFVDNTDGWGAILEADMDPWIADHDGATVAGTLLRNVMFNEVSALVCSVKESRVGDINGVHTNGVTFLHIACQCESNKVQRLIDQLLQAGANPNAKNAHKETTLHIACTKVVQLYNSHSEEDAVASVHFWAVNRLLRHGADTSVLNAAGQSCLDLASGCPNLQKVLKTSVDLMEIPALLPWCPQSDKHNKKLAQVTRGQNAEREGSYQYHTEPIGSGRFGHVYAGVNTSDGREVAIKCVEHQCMCSPEDIREVQNLVKLKDCEQIVKYLHYCKNEEQKRSYIVLELMEGNLAEYTGMATVDSSSLGMLCKDVITGLDFLHRNQILHRDINPSNILYKTSPRLCLKIADFGLSSKSSFDAALNTSVTHTNAGTRCWMAPELLIRTRPEHSKETDVFACGLVLHYLFSGKKHPFAPVDNSGLSTVMVQNSTEYNICYRSPSLDDDLPPESRHLVELMIKGDAHERVVLGEALKHVFLWSKEKRVQFVCAVGNQPEFETPLKYPSSQIITELQTTLGARFVTVPWDNTIPAIFSEMTSSHRGRRYVTSSAVHLVRFVRNCQAHVSDRSRTTPIKTALLEDFIFFERFPTLLMDVYRAVMNSKWDQSRDEITYVMNMQ